ncbi:MAG: anaerobic ribonucleoside-triphosphate reductase activating protein [Clostridia bacterium]|nr:anaerobic ribonucleoside-triphosphate reductase activating protein [Clostridia bacterium]
MRIYGMEKLSLVDFDGKVACTLFTGNCNFRCGFCHNSPLVLDYKFLPEIDESEVFAYLSKRKGILEGVCISGGEPTLEKDLPLFIEKVKNLGYAVKLDSNGTNPELIKSLFENGLIDYLAMDIKNNKEDYAKIIGFDKYDTKKVEKSVDFLLNGKFPYEFRTTLINEFHKKENVALIGEWIKGADKYFLQKFKNSESCISQNLSAVDDKTVLEFRDILQNNVKKVFLRGYDL